MSYLRMGRILYTTVVYPTVASTTCHSCYNIGLILGFASFIGENILCDWNMWHSFIKAVQWWGLHVWTPSMSGNHATVGHAMVAQNIFSIYWLSGGNQWLEHCPYNPCTEIVSQIGVMLHIVKPYCETLLVALTHHNMICSRNIKSSINISVIYKYHDMSISL